MVTAGATMNSQYDPRISVLGRGGPVVLVPGMDGTGLLFYRQQPLLARSYRVATYALRDSARHMTVLVDDLAAVIDTVDPVERRAIVIGESFGGALAMSLALDRPERVRALVILNSFARFLPQARLAMARLGLNALPWGMMQIVRRLTAFRMHSAHTHRDDIERFMRLTATATRQGYLNRLHVLTEYDVRPRLHELRVPVLFLASSEDHLVPAVREARYMAERVPAASVRVLDGHGHICLIAPDLDLTRLLEDWGQA
jgi:pimeloyl-ACP methyl ester carboxylesterase